MHKPVCLVDLDDTLFQIPDKMKSGPKQKSLTPAAVDEQEKPRSFMTQKQHHFFSWLQKNTILIPVTARSRSELTRVRLEFQSWKIAAHGGLIIRHDGKTDESWKEQLIGQTEKMADPLTVLHQRVVSRLSQFNDLSVTLYREYNLPLYLAVKINNANKQKTREIIDYLTAESSGPEFKMHHNNNTIHWLPHYLNKGRAVEYLLNRLRDRNDSLVVLGFGDSASDYSFLRQCSWFGLPSGSQLDCLLQDYLIQSDNM